MSFAFHDGVLHAEGVSLERVEHAVGTPCFVYSRRNLEESWRAYDTAFKGHPHLVCYAVKANSNLAVLDVLARLGSGFDVVSEGELARVLAAGGQPQGIVFSGVGKSVEEMELGLKTGLHCFNIESDSELHALETTARRMALQAPISIRVNPDVDAKTHPYISTGLATNKFGVPMDEAYALYQHAAASPYLVVTGVDFHIGSQILSLEPYADAIARALALVDDLAAAGIVIKHLNVGGGLGVRYRDEVPPEPEAYAQVVRAAIGQRPLSVVVEPGRSIAAAAGVMLTRVRYLKANGDKRFAVVDAAMNDMLRPALYDAWQSIEPVRPTPGVATASYDVVGPVCESADFLARDRELAVEEGTLLAVRGAGAYGYVMSSNYNSRPRAAEVMVDGARFHMARARESVADLYAGERRLPD